MVTVGRYKNREIKATNVWSENQKKDQLCFEYKFVRLVC